MANLSQPQALELIKAPKNQNEIIRALQKKSRHKLHTEAVTDQEFLDGSHQNFLRWVESVLQNDETYKRFCSLYRPPVPTNELVESIFSQFERVFESQNSFEQFEFTDSESEADFRDYRKKLGDFSFWETQGFETLKSSVDNIVVIDLPRLAKDAAGNLLQESEAPEPYYYILDIAALIDVDSTRVKTIDSLSGKPFYYYKIEYLIFHEPNDIICVFDDTFYRVFQKKDSNIILLSETPHDLGYCPARSFWTTPLNSSSRLQKRSPITNSVSELDWLLFYEIAAKYLKLYAPFPIYAMYKGTCNYTDAENKLRCVDGWLEGNGWKVGNAHTGKRCPNCANKIKVGPGNILELKAPQDKDDPDLLSNPVKVIPAEEISIKTVNEETRTKWSAIFDNCVGKGDDDNAQAKNEMQVQAAFESRTSVLLKIKRNFELIHAFTLETIARLRYGEKFMSLTIDYGDEFFIKDEAEEMLEYKTAKEQGLPEFDLSTRRDKINESRYRNNPDLLERVNILKNLDPFPDQSVGVVTELASKSPDMFSPEDLYLKINFSRLINKFEREQISVLQFASALTFDKKIARIQDILKTYIDADLLERAPKAETDPAPASQGAAA